MNRDYILNDLYTRFLSRKFLAGALAVGLFLADSLGYLVLDAETKRYILGIIVGYLVVEGAADTARAMN